MDDQTVLSRFDVVIQNADHIISHPAHSSMGPFADPVLQDGWKTQSQTLLESLLGKDHPYTIGFCAALKYGYISDIQAGRSVLISAREDFKNGHLRSLREMVHADVFDDFLEMSASLLTDGYKDAAAVIAGSTLEEQLRKLCVKNSIDISMLKPNGSADPKKASVMNDDLRKAGVYNQIEWRSIQGWLDIRNDAAHGNYTSYQQEQVKLMIDGIRAFTMRNPA